MVISSGNTEADTAMRLGEKRYAAFFAKPYTLEHLQRV